MWTLLLASVAATAIVVRLDRPRREARFAENRAAVLEAIRRLEPDGTGFTINCEVEKIAGRMINFGSLYCDHLGPLEEEGVIASRWGEPKPERGNRRPRHYWITNGGGGKRVRAPKTQGVIGAERLA